MKKLYHVTTKKNWEKIKFKGLKPDIGYMSSYVAELIWTPETHKAVYLFTQLDEDFWYFVDHWMARVYGKENLVLLEVRLPKSLRKMDSWVERNVKRIRTMMKQNNWTGYFPEEAFYNYVMRGKNEFVCYKKIPGRYVKQISFPDEVKTDRNIET